MKNFVLSLLTVFALISCEKKQVETDHAALQNPVTIPETDEPRESSTVQTCYLAATGKDSVFISLEDNLGTVTGFMRYKNFEKDSSSGEIVGTKSGDTLKLTYNFDAEGTTSQREIFFLQQAGKLVEGLGAYKNEGSSSFYAEPSGLKFTGMTLEQTDCGVVEKSLDTSK